jgi:RNA polymerase sigma-70 factor (ECF subfamily)
MNKLEIFESLLQGCKSAVEHTVFFRISLRADAEDVLQEVYITAYRKFETLTDPMAFKAWLIRIAQNKCIDYYRWKAARAEFPMDISERVMVYGRCGLREQIIVREIMDKLADKDRNILKLYYFQELGIGVKCFRTIKNLLLMEKYMYTGMIAFQIIF